MMRRAFGGLNNVRRRWAVGFSSQAPGESVRDVSLKSEMWIAKRENRDSLDSAAQLNPRAHRSSLAQSGRYLSPEQRSILNEMTELGRRRQWQEAIALLESVTDPEPQIFTAAISACAKALELEQARRIFDSMPISWVSAYNTLMSLLGRLRRIDDVLALLEEMRTKDLQPNEITYSVLINAYGMVYDVTSAMRVLEEMRTNDLAMTPVTFASAISACARAGDKLQAAQVLSTMESASVQPNLGHFTSMIAACAKSKDEARAGGVLETMRERQIQPTIITYTSLMGCIPIGPQTWTRVEHYLTEMRTSFVALDVYAYNQILQTALAANELQRCKEQLAEMNARGLRGNRETDMRRGRLQELLQDEVEKAAEQAAFAQAPTATPTDDVNSPLPAGWLQNKDPSSGALYYWKESDPTSTVTWERPRMHTP